MTEEVLRITGLRKYFPIRRGFLQRKVGDIKAVDGVDLSVNYGETVGMVGESGSGKTTVAYTVIGIYRPTDGSIFFHGKDLSKPRTREDAQLFRQGMQIVFQNPGSSLNPRKRVGHALSLPLRFHSSADPRSRKRKIDELLERVKLPANYVDKYPSALSGGEKQRVAIARSLALDPKFLILDEPTSALDVSVQGSVVELLLSLQNELHLSYLFITHNLVLIRNIASRTAVMYLGKVVEVADTSELFDVPLHPYTKMLLSSIPVLTEEEEALKVRHVVPRGSIPSPAKKPSGCAFHPRCPQQQDGICSVHEPTPRDVGNGHIVYCHSAGTEVVLKET